MGLLEGVERELGWKTGYRRGVLVGEWRWGEDDVREFGGGGGGGREMGKG